MKVVRIVRRGEKSYRVELENGTTAKIPVEYTVIPGHDLEEFLPPEELVNCNLTEKETTPVARPYYADEVPSFEGMIDSIIGGI